MIVNWQLECMAARLRSLRHEIIRIADKDHPYQAPRMVYAALLAVLDSRAQVFSDAVVVHSSDPRALRETYVKVSDDLAEIAALFGFADRVDSPRIPFEILSEISWVASSLLGHQCATVVRLDSAYTYSILSMRREFEANGWLEYWKAAANEVGAADVTQTILLLGFPSSDARFTLLHAMAAHELAHEFLIRLERYRQLFDSVSAGLKREWVTQIEEYVASRFIRREGQSPEDAYREFSKGVVESLDRVVEGWLGEMVADLVAARLVGPAFLAASSHVLLELSPASDSHPPGALRYKLVQKYLERTFPEIAVDPVWKPLFSDGVHAKRLSFVHRVGQRACEVAFDAIAEAIDEIGTPLQQGEGKLTRIVSAMEESLELLVPPSVCLEVTSEFETANLFWLLLYAGWHFRLDEDRFRRFKETYGWAEAPERADEALSNLILHALHSLHLRYRWKEACKSKGTPVGGREHAA